MAYYLELSPQIANVINAQTLYCRLCANSKSHNQLLNLQISETMLKDTELKLTQLNLFVDFHENILPKTVCFDCISSLKYAFDYIVSVKKAQALLRELILPVGVVSINKPKIETTEYLMEPHGEEYTDGIEIKSEIDPIQISDKILDSRLPDGNVTIETTIEIKPDINLLSNSENNRNLDSIKLFEEYNKDIILETKVDSKSEMYYGNVSSSDTERKLQWPNCYNVDVNRMPGISGIDTKCSIELYSAMSDQNYFKSQSESETPPTNVKVPYSRIYKGEYVNKKRSYVTGFDKPESEQIPTWSEYIWQCGYCQSQFTTIKELQTHSKDTHNACNPYQCTDCKRKHSNFAIFLKHVRIHHKHLKRSCHECFKIFPEMKETNRHKIDHAISDLQCPGCYQTFLSPKSLEDHKTSYYKLYLAPNPLMKGVTSLACSLCNAVYKHKNGLRNHLLNTHTERKQHHVCQLCGKAFQQNASLKRHLAIHQKKKFQCDICQAWFSSRTNIYNHMKTHSDTKPYSCDECGKCFRQKRKLKSHQIIHTDFKPFVCKVCNKSFRHQNSMYIHLRQHTGVKPYSCDICNKDFTNYSNHSKHMKRIHNLIIASKKNIVT